MRFNEFNSDRGMNKYGLAARNKDGKFYSYRHGKLTGTFDNMADLQKHQHDLIKDESVKEGLKFQDKFKVGDKIKAYDFEPMPDRPDRFVVGTVTKVDAESMSQPGALGYHIKVEKEEPKERRIGQTIFVPYETGMDHDDRITVAEDDVVEEGAEMIAYHKHPEDDKLWTFPKDYQNDEEVESPYMSNASMRNFLDALGYDSNFEDAGPVPAKEFIARTTQWLQKNIDKPSAYEPTTVDKTPGGPTIYSGGRDEGYMNQMVKAHNEIARKVLAKYTEVTHFGFN